MSLISGGQAGFNSVIFYNRSHRVKASRKKDGCIEVNVVSTNGSNGTKVGKLFDKIPFIRGMWLMIELVILNWRLYLITLVLFFTMLILQNVTHETTERDTSSLFYLFFTPPYHFIFLLGVLMCASIFIKITEVGKYHSAEHMVDNAYEDSQDISLQNVQMYSRVHKQCGTNLLVFILIFYSIFYYLLDNKFLGGFLSFSFGYEVYKINHMWIKRALTPVYAFSYTLQWFLFTSKPNPKHLEVSISAYQEMVSLSKAGNDE
ncbi:DUF1385 domain-containing protein [Rossellomorea aquimaris]|uniref:DUF1385 domain-containing protein n=1 Tax=Rossellomorea aquimaris TaxID=189382 RepID=UPI001CD36CB1|nr:DUF1385 domain-containing protein [Rossellomorea aquimaris]MCA1056976.1 DUF1385 domain-containing protein [Rossellomorea aquimaris]